MLTNTFLADGKGRTGFPRGPQVIINASREAVWRAISDIGHAAEIMAGIDKIEILEQPEKGLIGLKWRETRMLFGKPATAEKRITDAEENEFYAPARPRRYQGRRGKGRGREVTSLSMGY